jgi:hypothetical protein
MNGVLAAEAAILVHFQSVGIVLFVLHGVVIALLAFGTSQSDLDSHLVGTSYLTSDFFCLPLCGEKEQRFFRVEKATAERPKTRTKKRPFSER